MLTTTWIKELLSLEGVFYTLRRHLRSEGFSFFFTEAATHRKVEAEKEECADKIRPSFLYQRKQILSLFQKWPLVYVSGKKTYIKEASQVFYFFQSPKYKTESVLIE